MIFRCETIGGGRNFLSSLHKTLESAKEKGKDKYFPNVQDLHWEYNKSYKYWYSAPVKVPDEVDGWLSVWFQVNTVEVID